MKTSNNKIYKYQYFFTMLVFSFASVFLLTSQLDIYGSRIWPLYIVANIIGTIFNYLFIKSVDFLVSESLLSKIFRLIYIVFYIITSAMLINFLSSYCFESCYFKIKSGSFAILICLICFYFSTCEITNISRTAFLFGIICLLYYVFNISLSILCGRIESLFPVEFIGEKESIISLLYFISVSNGEMTALLFYSNDVKNLIKRKHLIFYIMVSGLLTSLIIIAFIMSHGQTTWLFDSYYTLNPNDSCSKGYIRTFGIIILSVYYISTLIKAGIMLRSATEMLGDLLKSASKSINVLCIIIVYFITVILTEGSSEISKFYPMIYLYISIVPVFIIPLILNIKKLSK